MARLPSGDYLIQLIGDHVILFENHTERQVVKYDPKDIDATGKAQKVINDSPLSLEDRCFAHFWAGYFYAHAVWD